MNRKVTVKGVKKPYDILIGKGILNILPEKIKELTNAKTTVVITDDNVEKLYLDGVLKMLKESGFNAISFVFCHGEKHKTMETVIDALEFMAENNVTRSDLIIALGGGIVGDVSGFIASSYLRGIDFFGIFFPSAPT